MAIFRTATGFQADDALDLDLGTAPGHPHLVRQRKQLFEPFVGQLQHCEHLLLAEPLATLEHLVTGHGQDVGAVGAGCRPSRRLSHQLLLYVLVFVSSTLAGRNGIPGSSQPALDGAQARLAVCTCTNVTWSDRRPLGTQPG